MDVNKAAIKLKNWTRKDLIDLNKLIENELERRGTYMSNTTHTPHEQCKGLQQMFGQAWIHG